MHDFIFDAHLDLAWNALQWNRDITQSAYTIRAQEAQLPGRAQGTTALPEMRAGRVLMCFGTLMGRCTGVPREHVDFRSAAQTYGTARGHLAYYQALAHMGQIRLIDDLAALNAHVDRLMQSGEPAEIGVIISMESADAILEPAQLADWYQQGVRVIGPAHQGMGRYAGGTGVEDGFTDIGLRLLDEMARLNVVLDLTHLTDRGFWQALDRFSGSVIASHNNCRALVPHQRQLDDRQIKAIAARGGVIGVALDVWMLQPGWIKKHSSNAGIGLARVVDHIDHICQLTGNAAHVGIGSDLDGGFGRDQSPDDLDTIADLARLAGLLADRGYTEDQINCILNQNWLRVLRETWQ